MNEERKGWTCPSCGRGVAPDQTSCDHGLSQPLLHGRPWPTITLPILPQPYAPPVLPYICDACRRGGICNCYRPGSGPQCITTVLAKAN